MFEVGRYTQIHAAVYCRNKEFFRVNCPQTVETLSSDSVLFCSLLAECPCSDQHVTQVIWVHLGSSSRAEPEGAKR